MTYRKGFYNFSKGELAPELYGRTDIAPYMAGVRRAYNVSILKYGGLQNRMGLEFVAPFRDETQDGRLIPFQFDDGKSGQDYALEFGQAYMRPLADGGVVLESDYLITAITQDAAGGVVTEANHPYAVGDDVYFDGITGMVEINGKIARVTAVISASQYRIGLDTSGYHAFTGDTTGVAAPAPPAPPVVPVVPPVVNPDPPPVVGGGGTRCVSVDTLILMANDENNGPGVEKPAGEVRVGDHVWTMHESSMQWGAFPVVASDISRERILVARGYPDATGGHRFHVAGEWIWMQEIGTYAYIGEVLKATVAQAHTYVSRNPRGGDQVLSHNIKVLP